MVCWICCGVDTDLSVSVHCSIRFLLFMRYHPPSHFFTSAVMHLVNSTIPYSILYEVFCVLFSPGLLVPSLVPIESSWNHSSYDVHSYPILSCLMCLLVILLISSLILLYLTPLLDQTTVSQIWSSFNTLCQYLSLLGCLLFQGFMMHFFVMLFLCYLTYFLHCL